MRSLLAGMVLGAALLLGQTAKVITDADAKLKAGKHDEAITALEGQLKAAPKDAAKLNPALANAHLVYGDFFMYNEQLPPFKKYPSALREYRKVLLYDKENKKAKQNIGTIEGIYKSMGRPIPQ